MTIDTNEEIQYQLRKSKDKNRITEYFKTKKSNIKKDTAIKG